MKNEWECLHRIWFDAFSPWLPPEKMLWDGCWLWRLSSGHPGYRSETIRGRPRSSGPSASGRRSASLRESRGKSVKNSEVNASGRRENTFRLAKRNTAAAVSWQEQRHVWGSKADLHFVYGSLLPAVGDQGLKRDGRGAPEGFVQFMKSICFRFDFIIKCQSVLLYRMVPDFSVLTTAACKLIPLVAAGTASSSVFQGNLKQSLQALRPLPQRKLIGSWRHQKFTKNKTSSVRCWQQLCTP